MKMKHFNLFILFSFIALLTSCGESEKKTTEPVNVKAKTTNLKGDLKEYFEVVDNDYNIKVDEDSYMNQGMITVEIKRNSKDFDFETDNINPFGTNGSEDYHVGFGIEIFDESGPAIIKNATEGGMGGVYSSDDVKGIMNLDKNETGYIRWTVDGDKLENLKSFQITSALKKESHDNSYTSTEESSYEDESPEIANKSSANSDVDEALDSYEAYVDQYIKFLKKAQKGDNTAMSEYPSLMQKANTMNQKLDAMQNEFNAAQMGRMMEIQQKMTNAAMAMQ